MENASHLADTWSSELEDCDQPCWNLQPRNRHNPHQIKRKHDLLIPYKYSYLTNPIRWYILVILAIYSFTPPDLPSISTTFLCRLKQTLLTKKTIRLFLSLQNKLIFLFSFTTDKWNRFNSFGFLFFYKFTSNASLQICLLPALGRGSFNFFAIKTNRLLFPSPMFRIIEWYILM